MKVLVTGFDPFNNDSVNPSWEAVKLLKNEIAGAAIIKLQVPTVFHKSIRVIREAMERERLYLVGHSQGGMLASKIVSDNPEFKGFISIGGTLRRMEDLILEQNKVMYWKSLNEIDSLALTEKLAAEEYPMLILQGKNDFQVTYDTDYVLWQETVADNPNAVCIAYEGLSHVFMPGSMEFERTVYDVPAHVDAAVIRDMANWVNQQPD